MVLNKPMNVSFDECIVLFEKAIDEFLLIDEDDFVNQHFVKWYSRLFQITFKIKEDQKKQLSDKCCVILNDKCIDIGLKRIKALRDVSLYLQRQCPDVAQFFEKSIFICTKNNHSLQKRCLYIIDINIDLKTQANPDIVRSSRLKCK